MSAAATQARAREQRDAATSPGQAACKHEAGADSGFASGMTPLMRAASDGRADTVQLLLGCGVPVNTRRSDGFTALALAAFFGHREVVELLLESGADVEATTRFGTSAEMWAASRGFLTICELVRQARERRAQEPVPLTIEPHEELRSTRRREEDDAKEAHLEVTSDEDGETTVESTERETPLLAKVEDSGATSVPLVDVNTDQAVSHDELRTKPKTTIRTLPDIIDPPLITPAAFHPGSIFLSRISSSRKHLAALGLILVIVFGFAAFMIARLLTGDSEGPSKTTVLSDTSNDTPAPSEQRTSEEVGTSNISPAAPVEPSTAPGANAIDTNSSEQATTESAHKLDSVDTPEKASSSNATFRDGNSDPLADKRDLAVAPTLLRVSAPNRKRQPKLANAATQEPPAPEEEAKPAPLSVEATRSRTTTSPAERPTETPPPQAAPLGVTSGKPKSKVIQWP